jgi:hypothetical protein
MGGAREYQQYTLDISQTQVMRQIKFYNDDDQRRSCLHRWQQKPKILRDGGECCRAIRKEEYRHITLALVHSDVTMETHAIAMVTLNIFLPGCYRNTSL